LPISTMQLAVSTHWNAYRHADGEALVDEILELGVGAIELGYDLTMDLVPGVLARVQEAAVSVTGVHNYCPVPVGAPQGHPELYVLASRDRVIRERAITHTERSIEFCAAAGGKYVVIHSGMVDMPIYSRKLIDLAVSGRQDGRRYEKVKTKMLLKRERRAQRHLELLLAGVEALMPCLESTGITLAIEILPSWESLPSEPEMLRVLEHFDSPLIGLWYDTGHGQIRENLGIVSSFTWLRRMRESLAGMHVHDVIPPAQDHCMPPRGKVDFRRFAEFWTADLPVVLEPAPGTPAEHVRDAVGLVRALAGECSTAEPAARILRPERRGDG
jgi:sugar phosphate isomerase/epimerase